jgi:hypothetical protein
MTSATASPGAAATSDDGRARRRAESQERAALMAGLDGAVKLRVAKGELTLVEALTQAGLEVPESLRTGASAPAAAPVPPSEVEISATGADPMTEQKASDLDAQKGEALAEGLGSVQPANPRTAADSAPAVVSTDAREARRVEAQRKLALMQRLPSELKLRVARREISLEDALAEAGIAPEESA